MKKKLEYLKAELETMYAVELLEYHNKNYLAGDNKSRSESRQKDLLYMMKLTLQITEER